MAVAGFALHQLRYLISPPAASEAAEHAYIPFASGLVVLMFALAAGELALRLAGARDDGTGEAAPPAFWVAWLASSAGLAAIFTAQELAEGVLSGAGAAFPLAGGGLWALPLALGLGALVAVLLRLAGVAVSAAVRRRPRRAPWPAIASRPRRRPAPPTGSLLGRHLASRAPPLPS